MSLKFHLRCWFHIVLLFRASNLCLPWQEGSLLINLHELCLTLFPLTTRRRWEDELDNATPRGRRGRGSSRQAPASASAGAGRRGGSQARGRRGSRGRNADGGGMFVSATGDPSRCCFTCGDPWHFANACPNRR